jgi:hypothetical protein
MCMWSGDASRTIGCSQDAEPVGMPFGGRTLRRNSIVER